VPEWFDPTRIQREHLEQIGFRAMLVELCRVASRVLVPGYEINNYNEVDRIEASKRLQRIGEFAPPVPGVDLAMRLPSSLRSLAARTEIAELVRLSNALIYTYGLGELIHYEELHGELPAAAWPPMKKIKYPYSR